MNTTEKILKLIDDSGKSDYSIRKELGLGNSHISAWRIGNANPSADAVKKFARYFNVTTDYLLGLSENATPTTPINVVDFISPQERELLAEFAKLNERDKEYVQKTIQGLAIVAEQKAQIEQKTQILNKNKNA